MILLGCLTLAVTARAQSEPARELWQQGQQAMREQQPDRAIGFYEASLRQDPTFTQNHLSLAAAYVDKGDDTTACLHLARYLDAHPCHHLIRTHYAELLLRIGRIELARLELNRFLLDTGDAEEIYAPEWVHCHQRLAEIAQVEEQPYQTRLHRGIALYLLAQQLAAMEDNGEDLNLEGLLCKAAAELSAARSLNRASARPCWYLHLTWAKLGQSLPAQRFLHETRERALGTDLTPGEQRALALSRER
jgi:hypothetical protein